MSEAVQDHSAPALAAAGIRAVLGAHAQAQDDGRSADVVALYTPDGVLEIPGLPPVEGHEALRDAFLSWAPARPQKHLVSNTVVTSLSGDEASAASDVVFLQHSGSEWAVRLVARYDDSFRFRDGAWKIARRTTSYLA
ncbi:nuclear transport factor 2 family protein [Actinocorallia longicatena]|uniref:Nuclear transport factor 2 family protein n=1 Tax=Actinocorallia longicatena TaxID=111803 RepID=A0ABP6Q5N4_9ACTN